jgi:capsular polysaccharide biosynthesis protein
VDKLHILIVQHRLGDIAYVVRENGAIELIDELKLEIISPEELSIREQESPMAS